MMYTQDKLFDELYAAPDKQVQGSLFDMGEIIKPVRRTKGGSQNPIVFHDYESFVSKFVAKEKTTDDTYTPKDVYEAVVGYVGSKYDLTGKQILRPFYPGGDYENAEYPEDGVVIDNPPFSLFMKIVRFYSTHGIPFFLFGPGMTIFSVCEYCTAVVSGCDIIFENKATVGCNFASNLFGDIVAMTAPELTEAIKNCASQGNKVQLPKYSYPKEVLSVSTMQKIASYGVHFSVRRDEVEVIYRLDNFPKSKMFGNHLLMSEAVSEAVSEAASEAVSKAVSKAVFKAVFKVELSEGERNRVLKLSKPL